MLCKCLLKSILSQFDLLQYFFEGRESKIIKSVAQHKEEHKICNPEPELIYT